ncbi:ATP-binding protein [Enterococcus sp. BWB1-3]|uniref:ATP-binding protein n=1 Tax=Enterococcus sp. BWB1-3 TaxID=2787713 RepID=UPI0019218C39|nr:ATP-binding protein [Enterococcus sp. BWB1-3]MBL1228178.1 ATP-binding protein [Enterococcus sp. BWB1-3]
MKTEKNAFQIMIAKLLYVTGDSCPHCSNDMYAWRQKNRDGSDRCGPTCMACGYKMLKKKEAVATKKLSEESTRGKVVNFLRFGSLLSDKAILDCRISNFKIVDEETKRAQARANLVVTRVLLGEPIQAIFLGNPGVGKSHLAMGVCWDVIEKSNYNKQSLYVNYPKLLDSLKFAFNDEQARRSITGELMSEIQKADMLVVDDIGAELGVFTEKTISSQYNNDTLTRIADARQNKPTIYTTNLNVNQLTQTYGRRIVSRMANNSNGFGFTFKTTKDKRIHGIEE